MRKFILIIITLAMLTISCDTSSAPNGVVIETSINISFVDGKGSDLLNPDHSEAITEQNTDLYYLIDGKKEKYFKGNLDYPKGFFISDEKLSNRYFMGIFPNVINDQETATTYIKFSDSTMDTIKVAYEIDNNSTVVTKVWYNGEVRWEVNGEKNNEENIEYTTRYFVVHKRLSK